MIYGPGQRDTAKLIPDATRCFLAGEAPSLSSGRRPVDWVYVDDVVDAFVIAGAAPGLAGEAARRRLGVSSTRSQRSSKCSPP